MDAWIEERRKRWPTSTRVAEKETKVQEAIDRGEILPRDVLLKGNKRQKRENNVGNEYISNRSDQGRGRGSRRFDGRGRGRGRGLPASARENQPRTTPIPLPAKPLPYIAPPSERNSDKSSDSDSDMDSEIDAISSKAPEKATVTELGHTFETKYKSSDVEVETVCRFFLGKYQYSKFHKVIDKSSAPDEEHLTRNIKPIFRRPVAQPKVPPKNPFTNRPSLLRNVCDFDPFYIY